MNAKFEKTEENVVTLEFTVSNEEFKKAEQKAYKKMVGRINVPGFRKGKAPKFMIDKMYGAEIFYEEAINIVFPDAYEEAVKETGIDPVDRPEVDIKEIGADKDLVLTAKVTVKPEVTIENYKGIELPKIEYNVSDADVDAEIKNMQERNSRLETVEGRAAEMGDTAVIDYEGFCDGVAFEGGKGENYSLELGSSTFIPGFEEQIVEKNIGDEFDVNVIFPEEYHAENLKGKPAVFKVKLNGLKKKILPEIDDEFAKDVSEFDTLSELKADTKAKLEKNAENRTKSEKEAAVSEWLCENIKATIPEVMVENEIDNMVRDFEMRLSYQGISLDTYMSYLGSDVNTMRATFKEQAEKKVKTTLALEKICALEKIEATDADVDEEAAKLAEAYKMEAKDIKERLGDGLKSDIAIGKTIEFLIDNSVEKAAKKPAAKKTTTTKKAAEKKDDEETAEKPAAKKPAAKKTTTAKASTTKTAAEKKTTTKKTTTKKTEEKKSEE